MKRLLVTGGTGYLGAAIVRLAHDAGYAVTATRVASPPADPRARWQTLDLRDGAAVDTLLDTIRPELVVHTAYVQDGPDLEKITVAGAAAVARAARRVGARLIHLSSDVIFDGTRAGGYTETDQPAPINAYGVAKASAEEMVRGAHPAASIVRTSLIYGGSRTHMSRHEQFVLDSLDPESSVAFFADELRSPVQIDDLAAAIVELLATPHSGVLNLAGADTVSRFEFAQRIARLHGRDPELLRSGTIAGSGLRRPRNCALDIGVASALLTTRLRGVREVLPEA